MNDFLIQMQDFVTKLVRQEMDKQTSSLSPLIRLGTVVDASGRPQIRFDGEDEASERRYPFLESYTPVVGDRVLLLKCGNTWVVIGKVV